MPGLEEGSIGIDCRDGRVYANGKHIQGLETEPFEPRQRLGVGMTFWEVFEEGTSSFIGLEGLHDLYPAIGTLKDVVVKIWFDEKSWDYNARSV